jgi:hypothetical protein
VRRAELRLPGLRDGKLVLPGRVSGRGPPALHRPVPTGGPASLQAGGREADRARSVLAVDLVDGFRQRLVLGSPTAEQALLMGRLGRIP